MKNTVVCLINVVENVANFPGVCMPVYGQFYEDLIHIDLVTSYKGICMHYVRGSFGIDFVSTFPWCVIVARA